MNRKSLFVKINLLLLLVLATLFLFNVKADAAVGLNPTCIIVTYYDDIDSRGFAWQTSTASTETKLLYLKDDGSEPDWSKATVVTGTHDEELNDYLYHKAQVTDLEGGKYLYKVGGNDHYSSVGSFIIDDVDDDKVSFTYVTDSQQTSAEGFKPFDRTLKTAITHNPDFIAFAGDLVDNSHAGWGTDFTKIVMEEWSYALDTTKDVTMNYPMMSTAGNHESAGFTFTNHNNIDYVKALSGGGYYSFDYNNLHFISLNTNIYESYNEAEIQAQTKWLEEDLANTTATWKVVIMHIGPYSTGDHSNDSAAIKVRDTLTQVFAKYKVDLVLQGHDHVYTRTMPYYYGENENGRIPNRTETIVTEDGLNWSLEPDGTYYITCNAAGTKFYPPVEYDTSRIFPGKSPISGKYMSQEVKNQMFAHIEIDGNELVMKSYIAHEDGSEELYDYIAVRKNTYKAAIEAIDALPSEMTIDDVHKLKTAYDLYNGLSERALAYVPEEKIEKLNNILEKFDLENGLAAYDVIQLIKKLDVTEYGKDFMSDYTAANEGYYNLTEEQKELVYNKEILTSVKSKLAEISDVMTKLYLIEGVQKLVDNIPTSAKKEEARLLAKAAYDLLDAESKAKIKNADLLDTPFVDETDNEANTETPEKPEDNAGKNGCKGNVYAPYTAIVLLGATIILSRRKRGECNE